MTAAVRAEWRSIVAAFVRFGLVGVVNTAVGFAVIVALMAGAGWPPLAANVGGYAIGIVLSYLLNRRFTLPQRSMRRGGVLRFVFAFLLAYGVNLAILWLSIHLLGVPHLLAQVLAIGSYAVWFFIMCRFYVFR